MPFKVMNIGGTAQGIIKLSRVTLSCADYANRTVWDS